MPPRSGFWTTEGAERCPFDRNADGQSRTLLTIKPRVVDRSTEHPSILYLGSVGLSGC